MRLYDTRSREVRPFEADGPVGMYVCGVTPYDTTHVGHARTYLVFDVLLRHLRRSGHVVRYVQNVTDVDDSILIRARETGEPFTRLGERYAAIFFEDLAALGLLPADAFPRATGAIEEMILIAERLLDAGHAYVRDGDVFFRTRSFPRYGELSRYDRGRMLEIEGSQDDPTVDDPRKEDPLDFPLWRSARAGEPSWESPWGPGRPGWHIECSTLSTGHLGPSLDIHGGGSDLVFPHHEAEIAQAECATGREPFARFWMHVGMVYLDGEKMSKSLGNMVFVRDLLPQVGPDAIRLALLGAHYREPLHFDEIDLERYVDAARFLAGAVAGAERASAEQVAEEGRDVLSALDEDLDTPRAIEALTTFAERVGRGDASASVLYELAAGHIGLRL